MTIDYIGFTTDGKIVSSNMVYPGKFKFILGDKSEYKIIEGWH